MQGLSFILWSGDEISQKVSDYSNDVYAITAPVGMPCQTSHYCVSESPHILMIDDKFALPVACLAPLNAMKCSQ